VWDLAAGTAPREFAGSLLGYSPVALSPDRRTLALTEAEQGRPVLHDLATGQWRAALPVGGLFFDAIVFSEDGRFVATVGDGQGIHLARAATGEPWRQLPKAGAGDYALAFSTDGRTLFSAGRDGVVRAWELETASLRRERIGHAGAVLALAVSPDGRTLASAGGDGVVLLHDLTDQGPQREVGDLARLWDVLADADAARAERGAATMMACRDAVTWLTGRMRPAPFVDEARLRRLLADLDHPRFAIRKEATRQLEQLGALAVPALRRVLADAPSLEVRRRVENLLEEVEEARLSPDERRSLRTIELLEHLATADAKHLLERLAAGAPGARQTEAARAALLRLAR